MGLVDLALLSLYATALVFSIIELGISAYIVDVSLNAYFSTNSRYDFALFCSIWTILVAGFLLAFPLLSRRGNSIQGAHHERWMAPLTLALNALTMLFWLACFAALADLYNGFSPRGVAGAQLAFAVMLWLIFLALLIVNILTALGNMRSERLGHSRLTHRKAVTDVRSMYPERHAVVEREKTNISREPKLGKTMTTSER